MSDEHLRGDKLLARLLHGEAGGGDLENELLKEFRLGYPISKLRLLLRASDEEVVEAAVWIASELGADASPMFADIVDLLRHPSLKVRFFALDCLTANAQPKDARAVSLGLDLIDDPEPSVRWKALMFLSSTPELVLRAAFNVLAVNAASVQQRGLDFLLHASASCDSATIVAGLSDSNAVMRRYAAATAARVAHSDRGPLLQAMESSDPTIKQFAADAAARAGIVRSGAH
jgi:hypothetical protein